MSGCGGGADGAVAPEPKAPPPPVRPPCSKCSEASAVVQSRRLSLCGGCLARQVAGPLRQTLRLRARLRGGAPVLVAASGGPTSMAMLHVLWQSVGSAVASGRPRQYTPTAVHVDTSVLAPLFAHHMSVHSYEAESKATLRSVCNVGFDVLAVSLEQVFAETPAYRRIERGTEPEMPPRDASLGHRFIDLIGRAATIDAKEDFVKIMTQALLVQVARLGGHNLVLLGTSATRFAERIIEATCKGRGYALPVEVAHLDHRHADVSLCTPMRECELKDVAVYCRLQGVPTHFFPSFVTKSKNTWASISYVTETLIARLQAGFPDTTSHINKIAQKLEVPGPAKALAGGGLTRGGKSAEPGAVRENRRDRRRRMRAARVAGTATDGAGSIVSEATSVVSAATAILEVLPTRGLEQDFSLCPLCRSPRGSTGFEAAPDAEHAAAEASRPSFCRACTTILREAGLDDGMGVDESEAVLPPYVKENLVRLESRLPTTRQVLDEFLIPESDEEDDGGADA